MRADQYQPPEMTTLDKRLQAADKPGQHIWVMTAAWIIANPESSNNPDAIKILDSENLVVFTGPDCFKCEKPYSGQMAKRPCRGRLES